MRVAVIGQGYVGLTASACLAEAGHQVVGVEQDAGKLALLQAGRAPIYEPGLQELLDSVIESGRLSFVERLDLAGHPEAVIVAVGSPPLPSGGVDPSQLMSAMADLRALRPSPSLVVVKTTATPGISDRLLAHGTQEGLVDRYVYSPEFLNQGTALEDWRRPDRLVVGLYDQTLLPAVRDLYQGTDGPWVITTPKTAEMIKYASNTFLATKISFMNEFANLCDDVGADVDELVSGIALDPRIGGEFLRPGIGYGDSCLPKDTLALSRWARRTGRPTPLLDAVIAVNESQPLQVVRMLERRIKDDSLEGLQVTVLGLLYEPWSDDMRAAPSLKLIPELSAMGAHVRVWDPSFEYSSLTQRFPDVEHNADIREAVAGAEAVVVLTEWPQLISADWSELAQTMREPRLLIDGKNCLDPKTLAEADLNYQGIGRSRVERTPAEAVPAPETNSGSSHG